LRLVQDGELKEVAQAGVRLKRRQRGPLVLWSVSFAHASKIRSRFAFSWRRNSFAPSQRHNCERDTANSGHDSLGFA
jgi:hypothetical protein